MRIENHMNGDGVTSKISHKYLCLVIFLRNIYDTNELICVMHKKMLIAKIITVEIFIFILDIGM